MLSILCFVILALLAVVALTRHRIFVICGFYSFYALLTVLDQDKAPHLGPVTIYRALYIITLISIAARIVQDSTLRLRIRSWPLASYFFLLILIMASALYSQTSHTFASESQTIWDVIWVSSLFWMAAFQVERESDLKVMATVAVAVSLIISAWVIWNAAQFNFELLRGGLEINQNYVSQFVVAGAIPLVGVMLSGKRFWMKLASMPLLLCILLGALILASRGFMAAFLVAVIWMAFTALRGRSRKSWVGLSAALLLIFGITLLLPGGSSLFARFQDADLGTLNERAPLWAHSIRYFSESSFPRMIFGQGISSPPFVLVNFGSLLNYHNQYLKFLMEQGLAGATAFLVFLYAMVRRINQSSHPLKPVMTGWMGFLLVGGLSSTIADSHQFWMLLGVMAGVCALPNYPDGSVQSSLNNSDAPASRHRARLLSGTVWASK